MDKKNNRANEDKRKLEDYKKNPMINLADSINRSKIGDPTEVGKGGLVGIIITIVIGIVLLILTS